MARRGRRTCDGGIPTETGSDSFEKFGGGRKTLKKYLVNKKIPEAVRAELPVLADEHGEVYAVCGVEIAERVRVTPDTVRVVCITIKNKR